MKVGDYVRTKDGKIGKIIQEEYVTPCNDKHKYIYLTDADNEMWYDEDTIIKSSSNIIDLIEIGDYVNGYKVIDILENDIYISDFYAESYIGFIKVKNIKSIVTHEQFSQMEHKVGE